MNKSKDFGTLLAACAAGILLLGTPAWASNASCGSTTYNLSTSGANALLGTGSANGGCQQVDDNFKTFSLIQSSGIAGSGISVQFTGATAAFVQENFSASWTRGDQTTIQETVVVDNSNLAALPPAGEHYAITTLDLGLTGLSVSGSNASVTVKEEFCLGAATFNCTSTSGNFGYIQEIQQTNAWGAVSTVEQICVNNGGSSCTVTSGSLTLNLASLSSYKAGVTQVALQDYVSTVGGSWSTASLGGFDNAFDQSLVTPEPASFALVGLFLVGLGVVGGVRKGRK